ncbi:MAG: phosphoenolpyruvate carboxykinase, partial [Bacteroidales bacterium]|nr:phosphoenolpyruvate carboxykinase [Bacteroidales bacterium]
RHSEPQAKNLPANDEILRANATQDDATTDATQDDEPTPKTLSETIVDAGHLTLKQQGDTYIIDLEYDNSPKGMLHSMLCNGDFQHFTCYINPHDNNLSLVITSFLRIAFAQAAIAHKCISIHSSCVVHEGKAYLFLGKSGTGKSTHARQWMSAFAGCTLLNDDNPVIRIENGVVKAYGTPWSGKTPCYKNENYPVAGIVRLSQAKTNKFTLLSGTEAFAALLPSCSSIRQDKRLQESLIGTLIEITETVPVGRMECLPDTDAAKVCYNGLHIIDN